MKSKTHYAPGQKAPRPQPAGGAREKFDPEAVRPAPRQELVPIGMGATILVFLAFLVCASRGWLLLYGDAVAHLGIARRILDAHWPGIAQLGGVWLPLPHLLILPFVQSMSAWQSGTAGAWPSMACYILSVLGFYKLCRAVIADKWAFVATAFFALNPNLLYLSTTAMTEPLFLALLVWSTVTLLETLQALRESVVSKAARGMWFSGVMTFLMVFTRYDGWVIGAVVWLVIAIAFVCADAKLRAKLWIPFVGCTVISAAGPLLWFWYNAKYCGDWLDFMRGPYSAAAIEKKTSPPGSKHYRGWHNPGWSLLFYTRTAQVDAAMWETGFLLGIAALAGAWMFWKKEWTRATLLLWVPLPFYVYSIAWGSVPIFIPQLYPHSYYNSRYGMEMLPALALCGAMALWAGEKYLRAKSNKVGRWVHPLAMVLVVVNTAVMVWMTPLVFKEGVVNSTTRIPFETAIAQQLATYPKGSLILMDTTDHIGAVQQAGIPLKTLIGPLDSQSYEKALKAPAEAALYVVAFDKDPISQSIAAHPEGLNEELVLCHTDQRCARFYRSNVYQGK